MERTVNRRSRRTHRLCSLLETARSHHSRSRTCGTWPRRRWPCRSPRRRASRPTPRSLPRRRSTIPASSPGGADPPSIRARVRLDGVQGVEIGRGVLVHALRVCRLGVGTQWLAPDNGSDGGITAPFAPPVLLNRPAVQAPKQIIISLQTSNNRLFDVLDIEVARCYPLLE